MLKKIKNALTVLRKGQTLLYPTDTVWGIGCDATNKSAVAKIFTIKKRDESKSLVILVDSIVMLQKYISNIPDEVYTILKDSVKPTSIIYRNPKGLAKNVVAADQTVAIRIVQHDFCKELIRQFGKPIVSTSANISGKPTPASFQEIDKSILEAVDYVVNLHQNDINDSPSRIIKINEQSELVVIRE